MYTVFLSLFFQLFCSLEIFENKIGEKRSNTQSPVIRAWLRKLRGEETEAAKMQNLRKHLQDLEG